MNIQICLYKEYLEDGKNKGKFFIVKIPDDTNISQLELVINFDEIFVIGLEDNSLYLLKCNDTEIGVMNEKFSITLNKDINPNKPISAFANNKNDYIVSIDFIFFENRLKRACEEFAFCKKYIS